MTRSVTTAYRLILTCVGLIIAGNGLAAGTFDGVYRGTQRVVLGNSGSCGLNMDRDIVLTVENDEFVENFGQALQIAVGLDGSFYKSRMKYFPVVAQIKGSITDGHLEADLGNAWCAVHLSLQKI